VSTAIEQDNRRRFTERPDLLSCSSERQGFFYPRFIARFLFLLSLIPPVLLSSCQNNEDGPIDPSHLPPYIMLMSVSPDAFNTDTINVGPQRLPDDRLTLSVLIAVSVSDPEGYDDLADVIAQVSKPESNIAVQTTQLHDDGKPPDISARDGVFSALLPFTIVRSDIGDLGLSVIARDKATLTSNLMRRSIRIQRLNRPPVVSDVSAPDTIAVGASPIAFRLTVRASDPDGQDDIRRVYFNSFRPDGTPAAGNPFSMYDDGDTNGQSGDATRGDGIYSLIVQLAPGTASGVYRFEFQASDRSAAVSTVIVHRITVR
jgi:hypothetical protein